jgi:hypothetical protein
VSQQLSERFGVMSPSATCAPARATRRRRTCALAIDWARTQARRPADRRARDLVELEGGDLVIFETRSSSGSTAIYTTRDLRKV